MHPTTERSHLDFLASLTPVPIRFFRLVVVPTSPDLSESTRRISVELDVQGGTRPGSPMRPTVPPDLVDPSILCKVPRMQVMAPFEDGQPSVLWPVNGAPTTIASVSTLRHRVAVCVCRGRTRSL
jgi:hypothetical protein